jgi:tRNA pseudouridine38-40 synthase
MNFKLTIQYDGTDFHGWQIQGELRTVQGELERAISLIENDEVSVIGSGRTDAGVHAEGQVANVKLTRNFTPEKLRLALNGNLWRDVRILQVESVSEDFHARFSAKGKTYLYRVVNSPIMSPFWLRYAMHEPRPLDVGLMNETARQFLGTHDWTAFSSVHSNSENKVRTINEFSVQSVWDSRANAPIIEFRISGNGFLRYMVRSIVGTLIEIGRGDKSSDTISKAIIDGNRSLAGKTAVACGLTMLKVHYD